MRRASRRRAGATHSLASCIVFSVFFALFVFISLTVIMSEHGGGEALLGASGRKLAGVGDRLRLALRRRILSSGISFSLRYFFSHVLLVVISFVVISFIVISFVVLSANNSNVNMQHIKRGQPKATCAHVRATRTQRAFAVRVHARCACSRPTTVRQWPVT